MSNLIPYESGDLQPHKAGDLPQLNERTGYTTPRGFSRTKRSRRRSGQKMTLFGVFFALFAVSVALYEYLDTAPQYVEMANSPLYPEMAWSGGDCSPLSKEAIERPIIEVGGGAVRYHPEIYCLLSQRIAERILNLPQNLKEISWNPPNGERGWGAPSLNAETCLEQFQVIRDDISVSMAACAIALRRFERWPTHGRAPTLQLVTADVVHVIPELRGYMPTGAVDFASYVRKHFS